MDFVNKSEANELNRLIDELLNNNEDYIANYEPKVVPLQAERYKNANIDMVIEDCEFGSPDPNDSDDIFGSDSSDDECQSPVPQFLATCPGWIPPTVL